MLQSNSPRSRSPGPAHPSNLRPVRKAGARPPLMKRRPRGRASPDQLPRGAFSLMGAWALKRAPGRSSAACAWLQLWAAGNGRLPFSLFCGAALLNFVGRRGSPKFFAVPARRGRLLVKIFDGLLHASNFFGRLGASPWGGRRGLLERYLRPTKGPLTRDITSWHVWTRKTRPLPRPKQWAAGRMQGLVCAS